MDNPLLKIKEEIKGCTACTLHELENRTPVPPDDTGRFIMIIGEAPGREENNYGKHFRNGLVYSTGIRSRCVYRKTTMGLGKYKIPMESISK